jgi:hypothetical protein
MLRIAYTTLLSCGLLLSWLSRVPLVAAWQAPPTTLRTQSRPTTTRCYGLFGSGGGKQQPPVLDSSNSPLGRSNNNTSATTLLLDKAPVAPYNGQPTYRETSTGIGGQGGWVYDVNALKRNLLQETVRAYKCELVALLQSPAATEDEICSKLSSLVQASPVRTTTDPHLLQGPAADNANAADWTLCYQSKHTTVPQLKAPLASTLPASTRHAKAAAVTPAMRRVAGKQVSSLRRCLRRSFYLENVPLDHDPCVVDTHTRWAGLVHERQTFQIQGLSRTSLQLAAPVTERWVCGRKQRVPREDSRPTAASSSNNEFRRHSVADMTIIFSDTDLCIIADPELRTYQVYTQAEAWPENAGWRQVKFWMATVLYRVNHALPFFQGDAQARRRNSRLLRDLQKNQDLLDEESRLIVCHLGSGDDDQEAWDGRSDPFVHLNADDRQRLLKAMSVKQIQEAGESYGAQLRRRSPFWMRRSTYFNGPGPDEAKRK